MIAVGLIAFLCCMVFCLFAWRYASRRDRALRQSIEWQFEKAWKLGEGWLPSAYTDFESDQEITK